MNEFIFLLFRRLSLIIRENQKKITELKLMLYSPNFLSTLFLGTLKE